jgi:hypothetical protein
MKLNTHYNKLPPKGRSTNLRSHNVRLMVRIIVTLSSYIQLRAEIDCHGEKQC